MSLLYEACASSVAEIQSELSEHFGSITCVLVTATHFHVILNNKKHLFLLIYLLFICSAEIEGLVQALDHRRMPML
jgi:hypothetical protein